MGICDIGDYYKSWGLCNFKVGRFCNSDSCSSDYIPDARTLIKDFSISHVGGKIPYRGIRTYFLFLSDLRVGKIGCFSDCECERASNHPRYGNYAS